jgi:hypothetical protein
MVFVKPKVVCSRCKYLAAWTGSLLEAVQYDEGTPKLRSPDVADAARVRHTNQF